MEELNYTCHKCKTPLRQHKTRKKYFYCAKCNIWLECWLPGTPEELKKQIEKIKEREIKEWNEE